MTYLADSNIIIYHLNGHAVATDFLRRHTIAISQITYLEVMSFSYSPKEEKIIRRLLNRFKVYDVNTEIIEQAIRNRKHKKIKVPDNIIAATAIVHGCILATHNTKDFNGIGVKLFDPMG